MADVIIIDTKTSIAFSASPGVDNSFSGTCNWCGDVMCVPSDVTCHGGGSGGRVRTLGALTPGGG